MKNSTLAWRTVIATTHGLFLICVCSFVHAADINFSGQLDVVLEDNGSAVYSGFPVGTDFGGSIDDVTFNGFISDAVGTTNTNFGCCIAAGGLNIANDEVLDAETAALINSIAGTNLIAGDLIDSVDIEGDAMTAGGGRIEVGLSFILNPLAFDNADPGNYPPRPEDVLAAVFFIAEFDAQEQEIYSGIGELDDSYPLSRFNDVLRDYWAVSFIETLAASGVTAGCGGDNYCPLAPVTRAQMAVFLERGMNGSGFVPPAATGNVFLDVGAGDFAASFIEQLDSDGITSGCGNNNYCPDAEVTRDQMAVFLLRARHGSSYSPPPATGIFADVDQGHWAVHWIEQLAAEGITAGCGGGNYCPDAVVTRDQMAVFLVRAFGLDVQASSGTYDVVGPDIQYICSFMSVPVINFTISQFDFQVNGANLTVVGAPIDMVGSVDGPDFSVTATIPGDVDETYSLNGSFTNNDEWTGSFTLGLIGPALPLTTCTNQQFDVQGARIP